MRTLASLICATLLCNPLHAESSEATCPPATHDKSALLQLKSEQFTLADAEQRNTLARALTACLGAPDPELRDGVAFEALSSWLRGQQLSLQTRQWLQHRLLTQLQAAPSAEDAGFLQPFAALVLAEVVRADRVDPHWDATTLAEVAEHARRYLQQVQDLRGFDPEQGWRHGVAHGADLLLQLAAHPGTDAAEHQRMLAVIAQRLRPQPGHFYIYGEPSRLARPVLVIAQRGSLEHDQWAAWLETVSAPPPGSSWAQSFSSQEALALRHNLLSFLNALTTGSLRLKNPALTELLLEHQARL